MNGVLLLAAALTQACLNPAKPVDPSFSYPPSMLKVVGKPVAARTLSGRVVYAGAAISDALVEVVDAKERRLKATLTDEEGRFCFVGMHRHEYVLRISKPHFNTLLVRFRVSHKAKRKDALLELPLSH